MTWQVVLTDQARRDLRRLDHQAAARVVRALERLAQTSYGDLRHLHGQEQEWRLRVGDWRVRLCLESQTNTIRVFRVLHRREAYR